MLEDHSRYQYHNRNHQIVTKDGRTLVGLISKVDAKDRKFCLLLHDQVGMLGKDGLEFKWEECHSVRAEKDQTGVFSDDMLSEWARWERQSDLR